VNSHWRTRQSLLYAGVTANHQGLWSRKFDTSYEFFH